MNYAFEVLAGAMNNLNLFFVGSSAVLRQNDNQAGYCPLDCVCSNIYSWKKKFLMRMKMILFTSFFICTIQGLLSCIMCN